MSYRNKTYVIFDGDNDKWAYGRMKGWKALPTVDFNFHDAHDLGSELTDRASEETIKRILRFRFSSAKQVVVLVGQNTRNLFRFVRWELDVAVQLELPVVAVNLNGKRAIDLQLCPPIIRDEYVVHIPFRRAILKYALDQFPDQHAARHRGAHGPLHYPDEVYGKLGLMLPPTLPAPPALRLTVPPPPVARSNTTGLQGLLPPPSRQAPPGTVPPPSAAPPPGSNLFAQLAAYLGGAPTPPPRSLADLLSSRTFTTDPPPLPPWFKKPAK